MKVGDKVILKSTKNKCIIEDKSIQNGDVILYISDLLTGGSISMWVKEAHIEIDYQYYREEKINKILDEK